MISSNCVMRNARLVVFLAMVALLAAWNVNMSIVLFAYNDIYVLSRKLHRAHVCAITGSTARRSKTSKINIHTPREVVA